jgi:hypothetical protein
MAGAAGGTRGVFKVNGLADHGHREFIRPEGFGRGRLFGLLHRQYISVGI